MPQPIRHRRHPVCAVISIGNHTAFRIGYLCQPVHGVVSISSHSALCVRFRQMIAVSVIGIGKGVIQRILPGEHLVFLIIDKGAGLSLPVGNSRHSACPVKNGQGTVSRPVRLPDAPALCIVGLHGHSAQGIRGADQPVHGVVFKAPDTAFSVSHGSGTGPFIGKAGGCSPGIRHTNQPVLFIVVIAHHTALRVRHGGQAVPFIISTDGSAAVIFSQNGRLSGLRVGMASHGAVLPRLMQHISLFVINIGNRRPLSVRDGSQTARLIVDSYLFGAVRIFDGGGAALGVIGVESLISVGVHSSGISGMSALRAVLIGKPDHSSFRILLFCHPAQAIIAVFHHLMPVFIVPGSHEMPLVIDKAAGITRGIRHLHQVACLVISIADRMAVRQPQSSDSVFLVQGDRAGLSRR